MLCRYYIPAAPLSDFIEDFWLYNDYRPAHLKERMRLRSRATRPLRALLRGDRLRNLRRVLRDRHPRRPRDIVGSVSSRASRPAPDRDRSDRQVPRPGSGAPRASVWFRHTSRCGALCPPRVRRIQSHHRPRRSQRRFSEVFKTEVGLTPKLLHRVQRFQRVLARFRRILRLQPRRVSPTSTGPSATGHTPEAQPPPAGRIRVNVFQYADCARGDDEPCRLERDQQRWPR